jgi:hypothetical protein
MSRFQDWQTITFKGVGRVALDALLIVGYGDGSCYVPPLFLRKEDLDRLTGATLYDHLYGSILESYRGTRDPRDSLTYECLITIAGMPVLQTTALSLALGPCDPGSNRPVTVHVRDAEHRSGCPEDHSYDMSHQQRSEMHQVVVEVLENIGSKSKNSQIPADLIDLCLEFLGVTSRGFLGQLYRLFLSENPTLYAGRIKTNTAPSTSSPSSTSSTYSKKKRKMV